VNKDEYKTRKVAHFSANRTRDESLYSCRLAGPTNTVAATVVQLLRHTVVSGVAQWLAALVVRTMLTHVGPG